MSKPAVLPSSTGKKNPLDPPRLEDINIKKCEAEEHTDGGLIVTFYVDPQITARIKRRLGGVPLDKYLYENILYRACVDHVF